MIEFDLFINLNWAIVIFSIKVRLADELVQHGFIHPVDHCAIKVTQNHDNKYLIQIKLFMMPFF